MSRYTLRITIQEDESEIRVTLEGRIAGPWVTEVSRAWIEIAPRLSGKKLSIDLRDVTYSDVAGKRVLTEIFALANNPLLVTSTPWTQHLADEIRTNNFDRINQEALLGIQA